MPLKEIKEPDKAKTSSKSEQSKVKSDTSDDPWKTLPNGKRVRQGRKLPFENKLHKLFRELAGAVALADSFSGEAIKNQAEELAYGYASLAQENDAVREFFSRILNVSAYSAVIGPTIAVVVPIMWHFGFVPSKIGVPVTFMSGLPLVTRYQEQEFKQQQEREQAEAERAAANGEGPGDGGNPTE